MPMTDAPLSFSNAQAVTASAVSTNTYDTLPGAVHDAGSGEELNVLIRVASNVTASGAATVQFQIISSANANLSSPTVLMQSDAIPKASLVAGVQIQLPVPRALINKLGQRYLGINYLVATGPLTGGTFDAFILIDNASLTDNGNSCYPLNVPSPSGVPTGYSIK
jgi:hypothetical protein